MKRHFKSKFLVVFLALAALGLSTFYGCETLKQFAQAATFSRCQFRLASVEGTTLAGISLEGKTRLSEIGFMDLAKLQGALAGGGLPLEFTLNIEAKNPNDSTAAMNKLAWILYLDDQELTSGLLNRRVEIPAQGGTGTVPLSVSLDLNRVLSGKTLNSMINIALNVAGEGNHPTKITLKAKPSVLVEGQELDYPGYVTVNYEFSSGETKEARGEVLNRLNQSLRGN